MATYRVKSGDNLWSIAENLFGDGRAMKRIMYLNGMSSTTIRPGMVLKLPTIVAGRNDTFRISDAEANKFGLSSSQQIASGQTPAAGQTYAPGWKANANLVKPKKSGADFQPDQSLKGVTLSRPDIPQRTVVRPQDERAGGSGTYRPGTSQAVIDQALANKKSTTFGERVAWEQGRMGAMGSPQPTTNQVQSWQSSPTSNWLSSVFGSIFQQKETTPQGSVNLYGQVITPQSGFTAENFRQDVQWLKSKIQFPWDKKPTGMVRSDPIREANPDMVWEAAGLQKPAGLPHMEALGQGYNNLFLLAAAEDSQLEQIPVGAVLAPGFQFTPEQLREMGYRISNDGYYFELVKKGAEKGVVASSPDTGFVSSGFGGGGYNPYGGGGGGGYNPYGGGGSNTGAVEAGHLKGSGSWRGVNFG
jgi:LysM repeat protein